MHIMKLAEVMYLCPNEWQNFIDHLRIDHPDRSNQYRGFDSETINEFLEPYDATYDKNSTGGSCTYKPVVTFNTDDGLTFFKLKFSYVPDSF